MANHIKISAMFQHRFVYMFYFGFGVVHVALYKLFNLSYNFNPDTLEFSRRYLTIIKNAMLNNQIPFWNPYEFFGYPLLLTGNYSFKAFPLLLFLKPEDYMVYTVPVSIAFTGIAFYFLSFYVLKLSKESSFIASLMWAFNSFSIAYINDSSATTVVFWVPVFSLALMQFNSNKPLWFFILSLGVSDQILSGRLQELEMCNIIVITFVAYMVLQQKTLSRKERLHIFVNKMSVFFSALLVALLVAAPMVFEEGLTVLNSVRLHNSYGTTKCPPGLVNLLTLIPNSKELFNISPVCSNQSYIGFTGLFLLICFIYFCSKIISMILR